jgi:phosphohistidine swiveling domain-containing protein
MFKDIDLNFINYVLKEYKFKTRAKSFTRKSNFIFLDKKSSVRLNSEIMNYSFEKKQFLNLYWFIIHYYLSSVESLKVQTSVKLIAFTRKKQELYTDFIDCIVNRSIDIIARILSEKYGITESKYPSLFMPHKTTLSTSLFVKHMQDIPTMLNEMYNWSDDKIDSIKIKSYRNSSFKSVKINNLVSNLRKLIWLKDFIEVYADYISHIYSQKIASYSSNLSAKLENMSVHEISKRPAAFIPSFKPDKIKKAPILSSIKGKFPLQGVIASPGDFSGIARIINIISDINSVSSEDIIVTNNTSPKMLIAMAKCKGIITEVGGLTSHAAIVSRELSKPCIINVAHCTRLIPDGAFLKVIDGKIFKKTD